MFKNKKREKMKIAVSLPRLSFNPDLAEKLISATKFITKELMSFKKLSTLKIKINVRRTTLGTRTLGQVTHDDKVFAQKEFLIELNSNQCESEMISTVAHELVHVQQSVSKRLVYKFWSDDNKVHVYWEGKELGEASQIPYRERPWEVEAFSKQDVLADMFLIPHLTKFKREEFKKLNDSENQLKKVLPMTALKQKENQ